MEARGRAFLEGFPWCDGVLETYVGNLTVGAVVAVLLARVETGRSDVDEWLWVVVGDLPPAYLVTDDAPNPACALRAYVALMGEWVEATRAGRPVDDLIPVLTHGGGQEISPTGANAAQLHSRLDFLAQQILRNYDTDLRACGA